MAITLTGTPQVVDLGGGGTSDTVSVSVPSGTTLLLYVSRQTGGRPNTVTFNGSESLTELGNASLADFNYVGGWALKNPTVTTANLVLSHSTTSRGGGVVYFLDGVDLTVALASLETAIGSTTGDSPTCTVTTAAGELVVDVTGRNSGDSVTNLVEGANQTPYADQVVSTGATTNTIYLGSSTQPGADGGVMSWTYTGGGTQNRVWAVSLPDAIVGPTITGHIRLLFRAP